MRSEFCRVHRHSSCLQSEGICCGARYRVFDTSPPRAALGLFRLDPTAACGDLLVVGDRNYIVRKVSYRYVYTQGAYRMVGKVLDVRESAA